MRKLIEYRKLFPIKKNELLTQHCSKGKLESLLANAINSIVKEIFINKLREINNNFISYASIYIINEIKDELEDNNIIIGIIKYK